MTLGAGQASLGDTANWTTSDLDTWVYTNAVSPGSHAAAPSFFGGVTVNQSTQRLNPARSPNRPGWGWCYSPSIRLINYGGAACGRYQINSVTFKATWTYDSDPNSLFYTDTPVSQQQILAEVSSGSLSRQKPMELYGAGLRVDNRLRIWWRKAGPPLFDEGTHPYTASDGGSLIYPIVGSTYAAGYVRGCIE